MLAEGRGKKGCLLQLFGRVSADFTDFAGFRVVSGFFTEVARGVESPVARADIAAGFRIIVVFQ